MFFLPFPPQFPLTIMTSTGNWDTQFDQLLTNPNTGDFFYQKSPVSSFTPPHDPSSTPSSSRSSQTTEVDPETFDLDKFISTFSLPPETSTHNDQSTDLLTRLGEVPTSTWFFSDDSVNLILDAGTLEIKDLFPGSYDYNHPSQVTNRPVSTAPDTATTSTKERKKRAPASGKAKRSRPRAPRAPYSTAEQRKQTLEEDDYVSEIFEEYGQILCAGCDNHINLDKRGRLYLQNWHTHRSRCQGVKDGIVSHLTISFIQLVLKLFVFLRIACDVLK